MNFKNLEECDILKISKNYFNQNIMSLLKSARPVYYQLTLIW